MLTGKRKSALAEMKWEQIEQRADGWFWNAPPGRKNKRLHPIPLAGLVQRILHPQQQTGYVFPGRRDGRLEVSGELTKRVIKAGAHALGQMDSLPVPDKIRILEADLKLWNDTQTLGRGLVDRLEAYRRLGRADFENKSGIRDHKPSPDLRAEMLASLIKGRRRHGQSSANPP